MLWLSFPFNFSINNYVLYQLIFFEHRKSAVLEPKSNTTLLNLMGENDLMDFELPNEVCCDKLWFFAVVTFK